MTVDTGGRRLAVPRRMRRGAYLLPSLFTIGNILLGFYAIVLGLRSAGLFADSPRLADLRSGFDVAAVLIFVAGILDALDGRIARLVGTESEFGKEYDSLADVFTFGVAPAVLTYLWGLWEWGRPGWLVPFFYLVCTATRLARFNVQTKVVDARYFVGLPTPAAAGAICSILFFIPFLEESADGVLGPPHDFHERRTWLQLVVLIAMLLIGVLMVSTFRYRSFKQLDHKKRWSYRAFVPIAAVLLVVFIEPRATLLVVSLLYTASGPFSSLVSRLRRGRAPDRPDGPAPDGGSVPGEHPRGT